MHRLRLLGWIATLPHGIAVASLPYLLVAACSDRKEATPTASTASAQPTATTSASSRGPAARTEPSDAGADANTEALAAAALKEAMALHRETKEDLLALFQIKRPPKRDSNADDFLAKTFGPGSPARINQGNKALARHMISKATCLAGLSSVTIQSEEQRAICGGAENMVPIFRKGRKPKTCIDVFEFPNQPCELPMVWVAPVQAKVICELQGKRLCQQEEWTLACRGDPGGGAEQKYAYGDELDLTACNTNKPAATYSPDCDADSAVSAWRTCSTNTEPAGAFPRCRSRFGVFDQHGNVAEAMARLDADGRFYSQLKGSAFFYVDVARKPGEPQAKGRETYPDTCAYDPRWHVEPIEEAWHVNYHLGFRCCKSVH